MTVERKPSLFTLFMSGMISLSTISILIIGYIWISHEYDDFRVESVRLRTEFIDQKKSLIKTEVENAIEYITHKKELTRNRLKLEIKKRVYEAYKTAEFIHEAYEGTLSENQLKKSIIDALRTVRFFDNRNYYFIDDLDGFSIMYPPKPSFEGNSLLGLVNKEGVKPLPDIIELVKKQGEGYYVYNWVKYTEGMKPTDKEFPKITYYKHFKPYRWFIAVGEYLDYIEDDIQKEIYDRVAKINFGNQGSISISSFSGKTFVSDNQVWNPVKDAMLEEDINGLSIFEMQKNASGNEEGGFFQYSLRNEKDKSISKMISFSLDIPDLELRVEASQSIDEIEQVVALEYSRLVDDVRANILRIVIISMILILITFLFANYISSRMKRNFDIFRRFFKTASTETAMIGIDELNFDEFSELADSANIMIETRNQAEIVREEAEEALKQSHEELEQRVDERTIQLSAANKELDAFAYSVSHDLRAPLRGIDGFSLALIEDFEDVLDESGKGYLNRIRSGCVRMGLLIDDMLKLSRLSRGSIHKEDLDLSSMVTEICDSYKDTEPDRDVVVEIQKEITAQGDATLVRAVLENLLSNAWKFTSKTSNARIEFGTEEKEGVLKLFVKDNGAGYDMTYANKLFNAFQRLHSPQEFEGTGIGLATVQRIIHRHGGTINAEGEVGKGAVFYFTL